MDGQPMFPCPFVDPPPDWPKPNTTTPQPQQAPPLRTTNGRNDAAAPSSKRPNSMPERARPAKAPQPEAAVKCPRCDSTNTKFCYYNNYSLSQPRHFCKTCRRYWTRGGSLRNVPVGGGRRRSKRSSKSNRPQPPARPSTAVRYSAGLTTTGAIIPPPSLGSMSQYHLPFLGSLHHNLGLTFSSIPLLGIQRAEAVDQFPLASGGGVGVSSSTLEQWRSAQLQQQQFPFQLGDGALGPPPPLYQMDVGGTGADRTAAFNILGQTSSTATTGATSAASTAKMEEGMSQQQRQLQYMAAMHLGENVCGVSATSTGADGNGHGSAAGWGTADFTPAGFHSSSAGCGGLLY